jgi:hypothetical protein
VLGQFEDHGIGRLADEPVECALGEDEAGRHVEAQPQEWWQGGERPQRGGKRRRLELCAHSQPVRLGELGCWRGLIGEARERLEADDPLGT